MRGRELTHAYAPLLILLSLLWGASYMFIKVAVREIEPTTMMLVRVALAALVLLLLLAARSGPRRTLEALRSAGPGAFALGAVNSAVPFTMIAWGEKHIDSGVAAIAGSSVPIFVVLLAMRFRPSERVSGLRLGGILLGLAGVAVLAGADPSRGWLAVAGTLVVTAASLSYAIGTLWGQHLVGRTSGPVIAAASLCGATLALLPFGVAQAPHELPGWKAVGSVLALAFLGTAAAQLVWYRLLAGHGGSRASLVTYLLPVTALLYGATLLGESLRLSALAGLALILGGVALGSGGARLRRREPLQTRQMEAGP